MTLTATEPHQDLSADPPLSTSALPTPWLTAAGFASLGAAAIHFAAAGSHGEHPQAVFAFTILALVQLVWGGLAIARGDLLAARLGLLTGLVALAGWALAKTAGLPLVDGLDAAEPVQLADASAAGLALLATAGAALGLTRRFRGLHLPLGLVVVSVAAWAAVGTVSTAGHEHSGAAAALGHHAGTSTTAAPHTSPYDPALPIDLGGTPGVTPAQQAAAENLVAITVLRLPQWADAAKAEKAGFRSIGDGFTGTEHLVNQAFLSDSTTLDPDRPESLVYDTTGGGRTLVAAMFMLARGTPLSQTPDLGGALVQWHTHENLCYSSAGRVMGITNAAGVCPAGLVKPIPTPMVHVWITTHPCGPFAALEGIAGGRVPDGETQLCDHAHGSAS